MKYIAGIVELDGEPDASSSKKEEPNILERGVLWC